MSEQTAATEPVVEPTPAAPAQQIAPPKDPPPDEKTVETPVDPVKEAEAKNTEKLGKRFAAIKSQSRELYKAQSDLKAREAKVADVEAKIKLFQDDPYKAAEAMGLSYEAWTKRLLAGEQKAEEVDRVKTIEKTLEQMQAEADKKAQQEAQAKYDASIAQIESDTRAGIKEKEDVYEYCSLRSDEAVELVVELQKAHVFEQQKLLEAGEIDSLGLMPLDEALEKAENYFEQEAEKYVKAKKLRAKLALEAAPVAPPKPAQNGSKPIDRAPSRTITNGHTGGSAPEPVKYQTDAQRMKAIAEKYRGRLNR